MGTTSGNTQFRWKIRKIGKHVVNLCTKYALVGIVATGLASTASTQAFANPEGGNVTAGSATISQTGNELQINQTSDNAIIEWNSFDIQSGETTRFIQPSSSSFALNRVVNSSQLSFINGNLIANGQIAIINPNGVLIGPQGNIDTAGFVASSADIGDDAFMNANGTFYFDRAGNADASIENQGLITVREEGLAALVAPTVRNSGVIVGDVAKIQLAAADTFGVDFYGDGLFHLEVSEDTARTITAENTGTINANGGQVLMTAAAASDMINSVINTSGTIEAGSLVEQDGKIVLTGAGADITVSGTLDVSGEADGGEIKVGGDYKGGGDLAKADTVTVTETAVLNADAGENGDGGTIIVWSDEATLSRGTYSVQGGSESGNGGLVETSSLEYLNVVGSTVYALAENGDAGDWLLDPLNILVSDTGDAYLPGTHDTTTNLDNVTIDAATLNNGFANIILAATNKITFNGELNLTGSGVGLTANAGGDIVVNAGGTIRTNNGDVTFNADNNITVNNSSTIFSRGGDIILNAGNTLSINSSKIGSSGGDVTLIGPTTVSITSTWINTTGGTGPGGFLIYDPNTYTGVDTAYDSYLADPDNPADFLGEDTYYLTLKQGTYVTSSGDAGTLTIVTNDVNNDYKQPQNCFAAGGAQCLVEDPIPLVDLWITILDWEKIYGEDDPLWGEILWADNDLYWDITTGTLESGDSFDSVTLDRVDGEDVILGGYNIFETNYSLTNTSGAEYTINFITGTLTVTPKDLTITADSFSKDYGVEYTFLGTEFDTTGLVLGETLTLADLDSLGAAADASVAGSDYTINIANATGTADLSNYNVTYDTGLLTVDAVDLTITADSFSKDYGVEYTFLGTEFDTTGLVLGETLTLADLDSLGAAADASVAGSDYTINIANATGTADLSNYNVTYDTGLLTVAPAPLTIAADPQSKLFGDTDPELTYQVSGLVNGEQPGDVLTGALTREPGEDIGFYDILNESQGYPTLFLASANYTLNYIGNQLQITAQPVAEPVITPFVEFDPLGRPIISYANQAIVNDAPFEPTEILTTDTNVNIAMNTPAANTAAALAGIQPAAGEESVDSAEDASQIEPAAGDDEGGAQDDIFCANAFLQNEPCDINQQQ